MQSIPLYRFLENKSPSVAGMEDRQTTIFDVIPPQGPRKQKIVIEGVFFDDTEEEKVLETERMITQQLAKMDFFVKE